MKYQADITTFAIHHSINDRFNYNDQEYQLTGLLKLLGIDCVRLSIFTEHSRLLSYQKIFLLAEQLQENGIDLYLCLHLSDSWADPSHQNIPASWSFKDYAGLKKEYVNHLMSILTELNRKNIAVKYIQIGNEISNGMLWPFGSARNNMIDLCKTASGLCRYYLPETSIVMHTDLSYSAEKMKNWYKLAELRNLDYDLIGLSYYPVWHGDLNQLSKTLDQVKSNFNKKVIIPETGYMNTSEKTSAWFGEWQIEGVSYSMEGQALFMSVFRTFLNRYYDILVPDVFYWGMFSQKSPEHFPVSLFDRQNKAMPALQEFGNKSRN